MIHDLFLSLGGTERMYGTLVENYGAFIFRANGDRVPRAYHTMEHVRHVVTKSLQLGLENDARMRRLLFSAYYHDIRYDAMPQRNNEKASAEVAVGQMNNAFPLRISDEETRAVYNAILATKTHEFANTIEVACLIDADLWGLGSEPHDYWANSYRVKAELGDNWWLENRKMFLGNFLAREHIFFTVQGRKREPQARLNLAAEYDYVTRKLEGSECPPQI